MTLPCSIRDIIPQQPPMRFVDELVAVDNQKASTRFRVRKDCPMIDSQGGLLPAALIEIAAQSCAAMQGYLAKRQDKTIQKGLLVGVDHFVTECPVIIGDLLTIHIDVVVEMDHFVVSDTRIYRDDHSIASVRIKAYTVFDEVEDEHSQA